MKRNVTECRWQRWIAGAILVLLVFSAWIIREEYSSRKQHAALERQRGEFIPVDEDEEWPPLWCLYPVCALGVALLIGGPILLLRDALRKSRQENA
jgi:hypothetical protein